jgi:hypothetical protein
MYCGGLAYYFLDISGSAEEAATIGLGPTVLGLGAVGLLFCIPLIVKIMRIFPGPRSPRSGPDAPVGDDDSGAEADAAIARYKARQSAQPSSNAPIVSPARAGGKPARQTGFGRRIG